jgi:hypothetical protein
MLTRKDIFKRIDEIVERAYLSFLFDLVGDDFFTEEQKRKVEGLGLIIGRRPLIELLYIIIRNRPHEGYAKDASLNELLDQIAATGILPVLSDTHAATIDNAKVALTQSLDTAKEDLKKRIKQEIVDANKKFKQETSVKRLVSIPVEREKVEHRTGVLLSPLLGLGMLAHKTFQSSFTTELTNFVNDSIVDNITQETIISGQLPAETKVYKEVNNDGKLCEWCKRFYLRKGEPIVYTLSELQANGSNYGKPKSEWKPVLGATHPRCRCQLHILRR